MLLISPSAAKCTSKYLIQKIQFCTISDGSHKMNLVWDSDGSKSNIFPMTFPVLNNLDLTKDIIKVK